MPHRTCLTSPSGETTARASSSIASDSGYFEGEVAPRSMADVVEPTIELRRVVQSSVGEIVAIPRGVPQISTRVPSRGGRSFQKPDAAR